MFERARICGPGVGVDQEREIGQGATRPAVLGEEEAQDLGGGIDLAVGPRQLGQVRHVVEEEGPRERRPEGAQGQGEDQGEGRRYG